MNRFLRYRLRRTAGRSRCGTLHLRSARANSRAARNRRHLRRLEHARLSGVRARRLPEWPNHIRTRLWDGKSRARRAHHAGDRVLRRLLVEAVHRNHCRAGHSAGASVARRWHTEVLPELPAYANGITVRHLIHHTSGLRDYNTLLSIAGRRGDEAFDNLAVLRITARQKKLNFEPGAEYLVFEHRLHAAGADRRAGDRRSICRIRKWPDLQTPQHAGDALSHRRDTAREMAGACLRCQRLELRSQHAEQRTRGCRRRVHQRSRPAAMGRELLRCAGGWPRACQATPGSRDAERRPAPDLRVGFAGRHVSRSAARRA